MNVTHTKIGIWGFGIMGKSAANFLYKNGAQLSVMDRKVLSSQEHHWLAERTIAFYPEEQSTIFFEHNDYIVPSAGIDIRLLYPRYHNKWITELDLFAYYWHKPIIAITGSVAKTTVTTFISQMLTHYGWHVSTGGNIGTACLDLIEQQESTCTAVLEVADVQLRYATKFAPQLAIWTNFFPNHLDWHNSIDDYFKAKTNIIAYQTSAQMALVPLELLPRIHATTKINSTIHAFAHYVPTIEQQKLLSPHALLFFIENNTIIVQQNGTATPLVSLTQLPTTSFIQNWLILCVRIYILKLPLEQFSMFTHQLTLPEHRLEKIATMHGIDFYDDAKSTVPASTDAALNVLQGRPIILFLGGLSKGIDRSEFIKNIASKVKTIYCFGAEAQMLYHYCTLYNIHAYQFAALEDAFTTCTQSLVSGDVVLFSPAGSSFDLFKNYHERGTRFKQLVQAYVHNK